MDQTGGGCVQRSKSVRFAEDDGKKNGRFDGKKSFRAVEERQKENIRPLTIRKQASVRVGVDEWAARRSGD